MHLNIYKCHDSTVTGSSQCQPDLEITTPFTYSLWPKLSLGDCRPLKHDIHSCQQRYTEQPLTPQPAAKRLHLPLPHLSRTTSLFHLTKNVQKKPPRRQARATISAHVNMQHLQLHCCKSPLKVAKLSRHISCDSSLSESASALHEDNHGICTQGCTWIWLGSLRQLPLENKRGRERER